MGDHRVDVGTEKAGEPLAQTVARLRGERDGLRRAMQTRALIEQAKGVLMARHRLTAEQAFDQLLTASQRSNVKLAQVAARVVASVSPPPLIPDAPAADGEVAADGKLGPDGHPAVAAVPARHSALVLAGAGPDGSTPGTSAGPAARAASVAETIAAVDTTAAHTRHLLTVARLHAAESYDDVVAAVADTRPAPHSIVLLLREADGALRLTAERGLAPEVASQWGRIPPQVQIPLTDAVRRGAPIWLPERATVRRAYPLVAALGSQVTAVVAVPLTHGGRVIGVLGATWLEPALDDPDHRAFLAALGEVGGAAAMRIAAAAGLPGAEDGWLRPLLDAVLGAAAVLSPVVRDGRVVDFALDFLNERAAEEAGRHGFQPGQRLLLTELPEPGPSVLLPLYRDVLADGRPRQLDDLAVAPCRDGDSGQSLLLRAERLNDRVVASWRARRPGEMLHPDLVAAEQVAGTACVRWQPATGRWIASPNLARLLDWPRGGPPLSARTAWRGVADLHWAAVRRAVVAALRGSNPPPVTVMTRQGRWLRVTLAPTDGGLRAVVQDVTELRGVLARQHGRALARAASRRA